MKSAKNPVIDILRAFSILIVLITHSLVPFLGPHHINILWNYLHFSVVAFVFCSGYGTFTSYARHIAKKQPPSRWIVKRFFRLYIPFAIYILVYWLVASLFPDLFTGQDFRPTFPFVTSSLLLYGGASMGWLPVLFLELTIITPIYFSILQNGKRTAAVFFLLFFLSLLQVLFPLSSASSRLTAWIFWSIPYLTGGASALIKFPTPKRKRMLYILGLNFVLLHAVLYIFLTSNHLSLTLTSHKYPPDLFYFSYGFAVNAFLVALFSSAVLHSRLAEIIRFLARHSYSLLFVHWITLDGIRSIFPHSPAIITTLSSIMVAIGITWTFSFIKKRKKTSYAVL